ncbi:hypothetical protein [Kitasatospora phosalacinea]|uniref:Mycothiol-dependent maleylpyruvate isomerase metal-binding domain-containing protein n=1 Tax=Kitasatospora phosalacinea TaxID=2065 RepID=A0A9W6UN48_9ACTN|nr:hypothetical protein [Kitasatospora phosalacinea]GLW54464.1 hypothetical protein Kpho01_24750 [Kitasatospora phosalacinea]
MDHQELRAALAEARRVLAPHLHADWSVPAGPLEWSCRDTLAHVGHDLLAYAGQVAALPADGYLPFDLTLHPDAGPAEVLTTALACGELLALALSAAAPTARAWHWGPSSNPRLPRDPWHALSPHRAKGQVHPVRGPSPGTPRARTRRREAALRATTGV